MSIKLTLLKTGEQLISEMKELVAEGEENPQAYLFDNPHVVTIKEQELITEDNIPEQDYGINVSLVPWIILSKDKQIVLPTDTVLTVVEPIDSLKQMYEEKSKTFKMEETLND